MTTSDSFFDPTSMVFMFPVTPPFVKESVEAVDTKLMIMETMLTSSKSKISTTWHGVTHTLTTPCYHWAFMLLVEAKVWSFMLSGYWREPQKVGQLLRIVSHISVT